MDDKKPSFLSRFLKGTEEDERAKKKLTPKLMIALLLVGILLMFSGSLFQTKKEEVPVFSGQTTNKEPTDVPAFASKSSSSSDIEKYEKQYESQLRELLESIKGVGDVTVFVNLDSSELQVVEKDRTTRTQTTNEKDQQGGNRTIQDETQDEKTLIIRNGDKESPIIIKREKPTVRGVAVTAKGAEDLTVKKNIIETVTRYLGVESHRVSVYSKK